MAKPAVLIIEDSASLALGYAAQLEEAGYSVSLAATLTDARTALKDGSYQVALLDLQLPDGDGLTLLDESGGAGSSFIVITADGSLTRAIAAMRKGAFDFLVKPVAGTRLLSTVGAAAQQADTGAPRERPRTRERGNSFHGFLGQSPAMRQVYRTIEQVANSRASVFVTGESGTGKEVTAEAIHAESRRRNKPFVAINCGAIPENLLESELFGHVKGAFTGAVDNRIGAAKAADGGTLFLDEICEMELKLQVKLLRFLQTGTIQRVGSSQAETVDVRVVCATNRDPLREIAEGRFREDLYYRLNVIPIHLPPLRDRGDDVILIAERLSERIAVEEGRGPFQLTASSRATIMADPWPGNIRELQNALRRAIVTATGNQIDLGTDRIAPVSKSLGASLDSGGIPRNSYGSEPLTLTGLTLANLERLAIEAALKRHFGNVTHAARELDVNPSTIYRKIERWNE